MTQPIHKPVPLDKGHDLSTFDCGLQRLNDYLRKYALTNHQNRSARTYVALRSERVVGYYTLAAGSVGREETPRRVAQGLGQYPVPVILLARLAVDLGEQGRGLGSGLVKDAILRAAQAADIIGVRALLTHAKDEAARAFYANFGFEPSPVDELHLYLLMKDIQKTLKG
jgi:GNAT superfamily N-acetyltransferase